MKYIIGAISLFLILVLGTLLFLYSGIYNISAISHHKKITVWMINTLRDNSIKHHSEDLKIQVPNLSDSSLIKTGFAHYREMCVGCHGAPGVEQGELITKGFYPRPPQLVRVAKYWTPEQLFWITKNGLKMSGMPAFGTTHSDDKIWAMISFVKLLPTLTKEQYQALNNAIKDEPEK
jgi:mono/diheme cytochrome c family protein